MIVALEIGDFYSRTDGIKESSEQPCAVTDANDEWGNEKSREN